MNWLPVVTLSFQCTTRAFVTNTIQEGEQYSHKNDGTDNHDHENATFSLSVLLRLLDRFLQCLVSLRHARRCLGNLLLTLNLHTHIHLDSVDRLTLFVHQIRQVHEHLVQLHHRALDVQHRLVRLLHLAHVRLDGRVDVAHHGLYITATG